MFERVVSSFICFYKIKIPDTILLNFSIYLFRSSVTLYGVPVPVLRIQDDFIPDPQHCDVREILQLFHLICVWKGVGEFFSADVLSRIPCRAGIMPLNIF
jgi:hypothetical protein